VLIVLRFQNEDGTRELIQGAHALDILPQEIQDRASFFSQYLIGAIGGGADPKVWMSTLRCYLPTLEEAQRLLAVYFEYGAAYS
jgi:hypothetical protein